MQSDCITEASKACFNTCCTTPPPPPAAALRRDFVSSILSTIHPTTVFTNHESLPSSNHLLSTLTKTLPNYLNTVLADSIRAQHYPHLSLSNHVCLDYVGHGLFSHSSPPFFELTHTSVTFISHLLYGGDGSEFEKGVKRRILKHMNLVEDDYSVVFTANQSSAFKILAEFYHDIITVYDYDNEAVEAMIAAARNRGCRHHSAVFSWPSCRLDSRRLKKMIIGNKIQKNSGLFVFPLQSRMTGSRYSYQWMNLARDNGWHVLLDASALAAKEMETLGLSLFRPDFVVSSFFNVFGENPCGFCCLFVKKSSVSSLNQSSANMGIIYLVPATEKKKNSAIDGGAELEIVEEDDANDVVEFKFCGLDYADTLGILLISSRLRYLINWLVNALLSLQHPTSGNGLPLITLYGPRVRPDRGPAVAFNVNDWKGERIEPILVQKLADRNKISLSIGFLKNIRFDEDKEKPLKQQWKKKKSKEDRRVGVVSASLGMLSNFEDVFRFWAFISRFLDADFVEKERWRYTALNQTTVEV